MEPSVFLRPKIYVKQPLLTPVFLLAFVLAFATGAAVVMVLL